MQREGLQTVRWMQFTYFNRNGYTAGERFVNWARAC